MRCAVSASTGLSLFGAITRIFPDQRGASATFAAIVMPALIGFGALGVETGVWFTIKLQNQSAADAAALSAAYEVIAGKTDPTGELLPAAMAAAAPNGFRETAAELIYPYSDGIARDAIAVTLQQKQGALLAAMFLSGVTITSKAVAVIEVLDNPCLLALGAGGTAVEIADSAQLYMPGCSVAANSTSGSAIDLHSGSLITATTLAAAGEVSLEGNPIDPTAPPSEFDLASPARIGAPAVMDPYATTLTHAFLISGMPPAVECNSRRSARVTIYDGNCAVTGKSLTHDRIRLSARTLISGQWTISEGQTVDLMPGTYWLTGDLTVHATGVLKCSTCDNVTGAGVTLILTTQSKKIGTVSMASNAQVTLNAPRAGQFSGLVLVQDANGLPAGTTYSSGSSAITGAHGATLNGLVYFPNSSMTFVGSPSDTGPKCLLLVAKTVVVNGASSLETEGCASAGLTDLPKIYTAALAE